MYLEYFKIALRNLTKRKAFSAINIFGLAIGMTATLLMVMYASHELSYDNHHANRDRIYRVAVDFGSSENQMRLPGSWGPLAPAVKEQVPGVEAAARLLKSSGQFRYEDKVFSDRFYYADPSLFDVFTYPLVQGDETTALNEPFSAVMSQRLAKKYFGERNPIGEVLEFDDEHSLTVTAVMEDIPVNTVLTRDLMVSISTLRALQDNSLDNWQSSGSCHTFLLLDDDTQPSTVLQQIREIQVGNVSEVSASRAKPCLHNFADIHLHSDRVVEIGPTGNQMHVYLSMTVALLVLLIACFNYMNLATAQSLGRLKETGMRRVLGASRANLVTQLLGESLVTAALSVILGLALYELTVSHLSTYLGVSIEDNLAVADYPYYLSAAIALLVGLAAGMYPALALSRGGAVRSDKVRKPLGGGVVLRKVLVVSQFTVSIILIIVAVVVYQQIHYMKTSDLGFDRENVVLVEVGRGDSPTMQKYSVLKSELAALPMVTSVCGANKVPGIHSESKFTIRRADETEDEYRMLDNIVVDQGFVATLGLQLTAGQRFCDIDSGRAAHSVILNEAAVREFGFDNPIGQTLLFGSTEFTTIGVVADYHINSFQQVIKPLVMYVDPQKCYLLGIRYQPGQTEAVLAGIEDVWNDVVPGHPFMARHLGVIYDSLYVSDEKTGEMLVTFAILAVLVSCLGLFGLSVFSAEQRLAEIGVRKVLGATVQDIFRLLSREYVTLVAIASLISWPVTFWVAGRWLDDFSYSVEFNWLIPPAAAILALIIALATVSYQSLRAARTNPIDILRQE